MERPPNPPKDKGKKLSRRTSKDKPFYEAPSDGKTAAQIVGEAKEELLVKQRGRDTLRGVKTTRPFTPRDDDRILFAQTGASSDLPERPPSNISIDSLTLDDLISSRPSSATSVSRSSSASWSSPMRPVSASGSSVKLDPIDRAAVARPVPIPKPPSGDPRRRSGRAKAIQHRNKPLLEPLDTSPSVSKSGSCSDLQKAGDQMVGARRVNSGPKERTTSHVTEDVTAKMVRRRSEELVLEERGEGDGQEVPSPVKHHREVSSAGRTRSKDVEYVESSIQQLIDILRIPDVEDSDVTETCNRIYEQLDSVHLLGKASSKRTDVLKVLFRLMDRSNAEVLLSLARLALALRVSGKFLCKVCLRVMKVSGQKCNDQLFVSTNILDLLYDTMISMDSEQSVDALLYSCGVIKFLAGNHKLTENLSMKCTLYTLAAILCKTNKVILDSTNTNPKLIQVLGQLTSALRLFAEQDSFTSQFVSHSIIDELCITSVACGSEYELMMNIASTLGKLTEHRRCCEALHKHPSSYRSLLKLLTTYTHKGDLVQRVCFVLGNQADHDEECRLALFHEKDSVQTLMGVFDHYLQLSMKDTSEGGSSSKHAVTEVLSKLIRVIANLSLSEVVGSSLCDDKQCVENLLHLIDVKDISGHEELVLNAMNTINNLSFYSSAGTAIEDSEVETSRCLMKMLLMDHQEGLSEACRIYGNLTRSRLVRDFLTANSVLEIMVTLLDSGDHNLVYFCCGVLVNFMLDEDKRPVLKRENGVAKLIDVLSRFAVEDWRLAGLVCQVLWNYSTNIRSSSLMFGEAEAEQLVSLLTDYIDMTVEGDYSRNLRHLHDMWRMEFCSVAAQLRKRIKSHESKFEDLSPPHHRTS